MNNFPISTAQISEAMNNAASILAEATGGSLDESIALLTAANTTVQDASKASTALRTVIARMRRMDAELDELGETEAKSKYDEITKSLSDLDIALVDSNGNLRDSYQVLNDLSAAWKNMSDNERAALAETLAGTRQQSVFYSLMSNFDEARNAMDAMATSEGELQKANDVYLNTIGAHVQQVKNAFDTLFYNDGTVEFINAIIDLGTSLLQILNFVVDIADALGGWKVVMPVIAAIAGANFLKRFLADGQTLIGVFQRIPAVISSFTSGTALATQGTSSFSAALQGLGITASATQVALAGVALAAGAAFLIYNSVKRAEEERREAAREAAKSYNEEAQSLENYQKRAEELHGVLDSGTASEKEAYDARKELISMQESLIEEYGREAGAIDLVTQSVDKQTEAFNNLTKVKWQEFYSSNIKAITDAQNSILKYDKDGIIDIWMPDKDEMISEYADEFFPALLDELSKYEELSGVKDAVANAVVYGQSSIRNVDFGTTDAYEILNIYQTLSNVIGDVGRQVFGASDAYNRAIVPTLSIYSDRINDINDMLSENETTFNTYVEGLLSFEDQYRTVWSSILAANEKFSEAFAKDDKEGMASAISDMLNAQSAWQDAGWDDEAVNLFVSRYLNDFFGKTHNVSLKLDIETAIENGDEIATQIEDAINYFSDENGKVNLFKVLNMEWDEAESNEAMSAYSKLIEAAEQFGYVTEDGTADLERFLSVLSDIGYIKFSNIKEISGQISSFSESISKIVKLTKGGSVQMLLRPEVSTEAFESAGWDVSEGVENMFIQTFSGVNDNGETIAMNFSPVLLDEHGKPTGEVMTYRELQKYADDVIRGVRADDLKLVIGSEFKGENAEAEARNAKEAIQKELENLVVNYDIDKYAPLVEGLDSIQRSASKANEAVDKLNKALSGQDYDDNMETRADAYAKMMELAAEGKYGSTDFKAYTDFFGISGADFTYQNASGEMLNGIEARLSWMEEHASLFGVTIDKDGKYIANAESGMYKFLSAIDAATESGEELSDWIKYDFDTNDFWFDPTKLTDIAKYFGITEESVTDLIGMVRTFYDEWELFDPQTIGNWVTESGLLTQATQDGEAAAVMYTGKIRDMLEAFGFTNDEIDQAIDNVKKFAQESGVDLSKIIELDFEFDENTTNKEMAAAMNGVLAQLDALDDDVKTKAAHLAEALSFTNEEFAIEFVASLKDSDLQEEVNAIINDKSFEYSATSDETSINTLEEIVAKVDGKTYTFTVNISNEEDLKSLLSDLKTFDGGAGASTTDTENAYNVTWTLNEASNEEAETFLSGLFEDKDLKIELDDSTVQESANTTLEVVDNVVDSVNGAEVSVKDLTRETQKYVDTDYDVSNITTGNDEVSESSERSSSAMGKARSRAKELSDTSINSDNKVSPLSSIRSAVSAVQSQLDQAINSLKTWNNTSIQDKTTTVTTNYVTNGTPVTQNAKGTSHAKAGVSLLGDEYNAAGNPRPELVIGKDGAYVAGMNGPVFSYLNAGDIVYPYKETKKILANSVFSGNLKGKIPAFAQGVGSSSGLNKLWQNLGVSTGTYNDNSTNTYNYNAGSSSTSSSSESDIEEESWFEKQYRLHNHLINMEKEDQESYLDWLNWAYKQAFKENIITEADAFKYEEEVFQGLRDLFQDYLSDIEFSIELKKHFDDQNRAIIAAYEKMIADVEKELDNAYAYGLDQNDDYVQELLKKWWDYADAISDIYDSIEKNAKSALDKIIDYEIKVLKKTADKEKEVLKARLDALKDTIDATKKSLQDAAAEEDYLEQQQEKRKNVADLEGQLAALQFDDSAWASKRRKELEADLIDAKKELSDFEKDKALEMQLDALDAQYEAREAEINQEIDAIDALINDPEALYNKALREIQTNTGNLYGAFIEYNRRYGTGNDEDITDMWNEAYKALQTYQDTNGSAYKDVNLPNSGGATIKTQENTKSPNVKTSSSKVSAGSVTSGGSFTYTRDLMRGMTGSDVTSLQQVLRALGYYNGDIDGDFGPVTEEAVMAFQRDRGLYVDGIVGSITSNALGGIGGGGGGKMSTSDSLSRGSSGDQVRVLQKNLKALGYDVGEIDGDFGKYTEAAVMQFQADNGLYVDGVAGSITLGQLNKRLGYASGTRNAIAGIHSIDELGTETIFQSKDGSKYKMFTGGEKVLNAKASNFLYDFANNGESLISRILGGALASSISDNILSGSNNTEIVMGDIIINGSASEQTVSQIRREQRNAVEMMLKEFNRLNK